MKTNNSHIPQTILTRKEEITKQFYQLADEHIADLLQSRAQRRFHAKDFGSLLFIHPRHLTNTIKLTMGKSPCDIMEEKIADAAKELLLQTHLSVADIGYQLAFNEPTNFCKFFKVMTGVTPLQFRKKREV